MFADRRWLLAAGPAPPDPSPAAPTITPEQEVEDATEERTQEPWRVLLYNDDIHTFDEVIRQVVKATGCTTQHAEGIAWRVHTQGKAVAYEGEFEECFRVQSILREIGLITEIEG